MAFGLFKNPFESLSAENQKSMVSNLDEIKNYFFKGNTIVDAVNQLGSLLAKNIKAQDALTQVLLKRQQKQMTDKDQKEMVKNTKVFGPALERIVGAIKDFSQLPEEAVDKFVLAIEKISEAFVKMKDIGKTVMDVAKGLMLMAGAIILFGLALVIALPIYLIGIIAAPIVFLVIIGFVYLFTKALGDKTGKDILDGAKGLMLMAGAIILFGIALLLAGMVYAELWKGMIGMIPIILTIMAVIMLMGLVDSLSNTIMDGVRALLMMTAVLFIVGIALYLAGMVYAELWKGMIGMIPILLTIGALIFLMMFVDLLSDTIMDGVRALLMMTAVLFIVGIALYLAGMVYAELWKGFIGIIAILLTIGVLVGLMLVLDLLSDTIMDGVKALFLMVLVVAIVGLLLVLASKFFNELYVGFVASWPILIVIGALIGLMMIIDSMSETIYDGVKALFVMVLIFAIVGVILYFIGKYGEEMQAGLGASWPIFILIGVLIGLMFAISLIEGEVLQGALALGVIAVAMVILGAALLIYKSADFGAADAVILSALIIVLGLVATVLGVAMEAGLLPLLGAAAMAAIGLALLPLSLGLVTYKASKFEEKDAVILAGLIIVLATVATVLGNPFTVWMTAAGAGAMILIGASLVDLTDSLKTYKESGWKEEDGESLIGAIASILKAFSIISDDDLKRKYGINASWSDIRMGTIALSGVGNIMTELARGIQNFSSMKFVEYEVVKDKDGNSRLQVKEIRKLTDAEIQQAGVNFGAVITAILDPIGKVGKAEMDSEGWFSGGVVSKGIEALTGVGNIMTSMAQGVQDFANLKFTEFEIYTDKDGRRSIQPKAIRQLTDADFKLAGEGFGKVLDAILEPIAKVGQAEMDGNLWFDGEAVSTGIKALTGVGNIMTGLAKGVQDFANLTFTTYEVVNKGTPDAKIVPKDITTLTEADFTKAGTNLDKIINAILDPIIKAGLKYDENDDEIDDFIEIFPPIIDHINKTAEAAGKWADIDPYKPGMAFSNFVTTVFNAFNKPDSALVGWRLGDFTKNIDILVNGSTKLEKVADSFERISDAFGEMKEHINGMELERLTQVTKMMGFLDSLANGNSDNIVADMGEAITKGMETLKDILEEIKTQLGTSAAPAADAAAPANPVGIGPGTSQGKPPAAAKPAAEQKPDMSGVVTAINNLNKLLTTTGIKIKKGVTE